MTPAEIKALVERLEEAMSRDGKPRGDHMIGPYAALAVASLESDEDGGVEMASVYDTASRCIANETAMFKTLSLSAAEAATALRSFMDGGWRPIETAPKDGTLILCLYPDRYGHDRYSLRYWSTGEWPSSGRTHGWCDQHRQLRKTEPTFWLPLPTPPTVEGEAGA